SVRRAYTHAGIGYEHNGAFGSAWTPRLSAAFYLREPSASELLGDTKLVFNVGRGIKAPSAAQENSSLFKLLAAAPASNVAADPIGPERSRSLDLGLEQGLWAGRLRLRASYFDNRYSDLIEFLGKTALVQLGVPREAAAATAFGASVNTASYRARRLDSSLHACSAGALHFTALYPSLHANVLQSCVRRALVLAVNPSYPGIPIGAYSPLVGARPFRRPPHAGSLLLTYSRGPAQVSLA